MYHRPRKKFSNKYVMLTKQPPLFQYHRDNALSANYMPSRRRLKNYLCVAFLPKRSELFVDQLPLLRYAVCNDHLVLDLIFLR